VGSSADKNFSYIPKGYTIPDDCEYFHYTSNNTIYGTEVLETPNVNMPLVSDMSSDFMSHPVDVSKYDLIYAGAQKNLGPAGVTIVIVKTAALGKVDRQIPTMLDYRTHIAKGSMFNTPPVLPIYSCLQTLKWYKQLGGLKVIEKMNIEKSEMLYKEIDRNKLFVGTAAKEDRSRMNVCFVWLLDMSRLKKISWILLLQKEWLELKAIVLLEVSVLRFIMPCQKKVYRH
jgi:Phosphoserine aminotransferase